MHLQCNIHILLVLLHVILRTSVRHGGAIDWPFLMPYGSADKLYPYSRERFRGLVAEVLVNTGTGCLNTEATKIPRV